MTAEAWIQLGFTLSPWLAMFVVFAVLEVAFPPARDKAD